MEKYFLSSNFYSLENFENFKYNIVFYIENSKLDIIFVMKFFHGKIIFISFE